MINCSKCGKELNDSAKFCRYCGTPTLSESAEKTQENFICPKCQKSIPQTAKFCKFCGESIAFSEEKKQEGNDGVSVNANFISWHVLPGQLAVKIDENDIASYKTVKGVYVAPGTKALIFVNGSYAATLESGSYHFKGFSSEAQVSGENSNAVYSFMRKIANHITNGVSALFGGTHALHNDQMGQRIMYTVVLVRSAEFPLVYELKNVLTQDIRVDVGLHMLCQISDMDGFFNGQLLDKKSVSTQEFANSLLPSVNTVINYALKTISSQDINYNEKVTADILDRLQKGVTSIYSYVSVVNIISLTTQQEELEKIRVLKEELYVAELELEQLQLRNDYLNRLQSVEHQNELRLAREDADFVALMNKIDQDNMLTEDQKAAFVQMLQAQALLRTARSESEVFVAINKLKQTDLLSQEEVDTLARQISHRADMDDRANEHALVMATLQNRVLQEREALKWKLESQRSADAYNDERREADFEFKKREQENQLDMLRKAQEIRLAREQDEHRRTMEAEKMRIDSELEHHKLNATMSFEQIMASNPNISPEAAAALAKKFEAEAAAAQNAKIDEIRMQQNEMLQNLLQQQMNLTGNVVAAQNQHNANLFAMKEQELHRIHTDSEKEKDRFLSGMQTTISSVANATRPPVATVNPYGNSNQLATKSEPASQTPADDGQNVFCSNCGTKNSAKEKNCRNCGTVL